MRNGLTRHYIGFVLRRRVWVLAGVVILTALAGYSTSRMVIGNPLKVMFRAGDFEEYEEQTKRFGSDIVLVVGIEDPDYLTPAGQERLRKAISAAEDLEPVAQVRSVLDAVHLEPGPLAPVPVRYADEALADPSRIPELKQRLAQDPLAGGLLVAHDGESTAVMVVLSADVIADPNPAGKHRGAAIRCFEEVYGPERLHRAGLHVVTREVIRQTELAVWLTAPLGALVVLICVWVLFGRLWPATISILVGVLGVVWTMGVVAIFHPQFNILLAMLPAIMIIIAVSDVVHLCSAYLLELEAGRSKQEAILEACSDVGRACLFTSLTTFVGFVGLSFVPVPAFQILGWTLGLGVGVALLLAVTLSPIAFSLLPTPRPLREGTARRPQQVMDRGLACMRNLALRHPKWVIGVFAALTLASVYGASQFAIETDFIERLSEDNPVRRDADWFGEHYHGTNVLHVFVKAPRPEDLGDPAWLAQVAAYQETIRGVEGVQQVSSLVDVVSAVYRATPRGRDAPPGALPERPEDLQLILGLMQMGRGDELRGLIDSQEGSLRILVAVEHMGMRDTATAAHRIEACASLQGSEVNATSIKIMVGEFVDDVVSAQLGGLAITLSIITVLMVLGLRSLRVGVISMVPNLIPLALVAGCLGLFWDRVDSDCLVLLFIALGIGVDDTIHFLTRYRLESIRGLSPAKAVERTFAFAGRGIAMTTIILGLGLMPSLMSDYFLMRMLGSILPLCFLIALLADVLLIPAMAQVGWLSFQATAAGEAESEVAPERPVGPSPSPVTTTKSPPPH